MSTPADLGRIRSGLLGVAGVHRDLLVLCPSEVEKLVNLGAAVLVSTTIAGTAGTIAAATVLGAGSFPAWVWPPAVLVGVVYGLVVFAIDRFLVSTPLNPPDPDTPPPSPARVAVRLVTGVTPRLVLAVLMGALAAEPLLLVVFRTEINTRLDTQQADLVQAERDRIEATYATELDRIDTRTTNLTATDPALTAARETVTNLDGEIATVEADLASLQLSLRDEIAGVATDGSTGRTGDGPVADQIRAQIAQTETRLDGLTTQRATAATALDAVLSDNPVDPDTVTAELDTLAVQRSELEAARTTDLAAIPTSTARPDGLLARIEALEWLTRHRTATGEAGGLSAAGVAVWLLRAWLITLDVLPIASKVALAMRQVRPYDEVVAAHAAGERRRARALARLTPPLDLTSGLPAAYRTRPGLIAPAPTTRPTSDGAEGQDDVDTKPPADREEPPELHPTTTTAGGAGEGPVRRPRGLSAARGLVAITDRTTPTPTPTPAAGSGQVRPPVPAEITTDRHRLPAPRPDTPPPTAQLCFGGLA
jgi:hypothetical protein